MSIFQQIITKKHITAQSDKIKAAYGLFTAYFHNQAIQENILSSKEEQFQEGFLRELFVKILGYTLNPDANYNLITESKNEKDAKKADGAIIIKGEVVGVIELKDHKTIDLKQIETQAFGYKNNNRKASYVITSNFEKLRFYIDNAVEFEEFNLFTLTESEFAVLWLCLAYENISRDLPKQIKAESVNSENDITKKLYKDYSEFKRALFADLVANNPEHDQLTLFKKSQKLLDRLLFILFAEDCGLLPANSIVQIIEQWEKLKELDEYRPLYERFKKYFGYLNTGHKGAKHEIFAYNGGLFKPDELLDTVKISDEVLYTHSKKISAYNFASEVDVNILGHIFENSLTEIEEITNSITAGEDTRQTSKRKKDGVFYTPRYITTYIVENTLGKLCADKKAELEIVEEEYVADKKRQLATKKRLDDKLKAYREWLLQLTICDPACGSGAFLNAALDYLMSEHRLVDELTAKLLGHSIAFPNIENAILENNLFGVDINEESVEIAKLSLWLRTAKPHRKLNSLNNNIKCGNSLISDLEVAGDKAFDWHKEFPQVFAKGGFDVVIGNPPYVHLENIRETSEGLANIGYKTYDKRGDLYCLFVEKAFDLLRADGYNSYIMPNKWMQAGYGRSLREFFLTKELVRLIDFGDIQIFEGATTYPCIYVSRNSNPQREILVSVLQTCDNEDFYSNVANTSEIFDINQFGSNTWVISSKEDHKLLEKLKSNHKTLSEFISKSSYRGIIPGLSEAFIIDDEKRKVLTNEDHNSEKIIGSVLRGRNLTRYGTPNISELDHIILASYGSYQFLQNEYPAVYRHIAQYEELLRKRGQCSGSKETIDKPYTGQHHWLELDNCPTIEYIDTFSKPKIMYQAFQVKPCFMYDESGLFCNNSMWFIPTDNKALLAILNSKVGWWLISKYCSQIQNGYQLIWKYFGQIPIADTTPQLAEQADKMLRLNADLQVVRSKFLRRLQDNFEGIKITGAIEKFDTLDFAAFVKELAKQKIKLSLKQQDEWEEYFNAYRTDCQALTSEITTTDNHIDQMVYELYGLTDEEIIIVEK